VVLNIPVRFKSIPSLKLFKDKIFFAKLNPVWVRLQFSSFPFSIKSLLKEIIINHINALLLAILESWPIKFSKISKD
jgi:hypothetical protein